MLEIYFIESVWWALKYNIPLEEVIFILKSYWATYFVILRQLYNNFYYTEIYP